MKLQLITLDGLKMDDDVYEVILPTSEGAIAVYPGHEPLVTIAVPGILAVRVKKTDLDESRQYFALNGGVAEIDPSRLRILVDDADSPEDIVAAEVQKALELAQKQKSEAKNQVELDKAQQMIDRSAVKLKVAGLRRRHTPR
jgi:F-type H+-transporting ATPase subunit epsilon